MSHWKLDRYQLIFFHPPKTGGSALYWHFNKSIPMNSGRISGGNDLPNKIREQMDPADWETYQGILTVREPFRRAVSGWRFFAEGLSSGRTFEEYLERVLHPDYRDRALNKHLPCVRWLPEDKDVLIYKTEDLSEKFPGIKPMRVTKGPTWDDVWTPKLQRRIEDYYAEDYERFDYATPR